jgi:hypothetical protein
MIINCGPWNMRANVRVSSAADCGKQFFQKIRFIEKVPQSKEHWEKCFKRRDSRA